MMTYSSLRFCFSASRSDRKRDAAIALPSGVIQCRDISYGSHGKDNLLDIYYPEGTTQPLPTIVASMAAAMSTAPRKSIAAMVWIWQDGDSPS